MKELNVYLRAARELTQRVDHEPSAEEIAEMVDKPLEEVKEMLGLNEKITSVDSPAGLEGDRPLIETLACSVNVDPARILSNNTLHSMIEDWLDQLPEQQCEIIARRYGLRGYERMTLEEVGREIGLTRERVRQIQVDALKFLRQVLESQGFDETNLFDGD